MPYFQSYQTKKPTSLPQPPKPKTAFDTMAPPMMAACKFAALTMKRKESAGVALAFLNLVGGYSDRAGLRDKCEFPKHKKRAILRTTSSLACLPLMRKACKHM